uniref:Uncharacterized protein n=1 Tax=Sus scrofa TaxID=9823 RepID=A0A8D1DT96_PIG
IKLSWEGVRRGELVSYQPGYHIRNKSLKKIHKAASLGNVAGVQHILLLKKNGLDDRDRKNRPPSAGKKNVQIFFWNTGLTQMSWTSMATLPSTMLPLIRIPPWQQSCFHTMPTLRQKTRYGSPNFHFLIFLLVI